MARKRPGTGSAGKKAAKAGARKQGRTKASKARKAAKKSGAAKGAKKQAPTVKSARAAKSARRAAAKKASARKSAVKKASASKAKAAKTARKSAAASPKPAPRRTAPRISAGRRATPKTTASREALAKKALATKTVAKPATAARKPAKKRPARTRQPAKAQTIVRAPGAATGKTARSRIVSRTAQKLAPPVLRDATRRRVVKPTAPRPEKPPAPTRRPPFRLHALGVRDEHATDRPAVEALLNEAFGRPDEARIVDQLRGCGDIVCALVAEYGGEIVGHVAFSRADATVDGRSVKAVILAPLAVAPAGQGRGIGSVLLGAGVEAVRTAGYAAVFVLGAPDFYGRFGFSPEAAKAFESPWKDGLLALELEPEALSGAAGSLSPSSALLP